MGIMLYEHNRTAYEAAVSMLHSTGRAAVLHPTGTGKSFIGFKLCEDFPEKKVFWLSPSEYIFNTQLENLKGSAGGYFPENVEFCTYARLMRMSGPELEEIRPGYIILDEFHRCGAQMWGQGVRRLLEICKDVPVLGLSATAVRYLDGQRDMADELFDHHVASEMTLGEAVARGIFRPSRYVTTLYSCQKDLARYEQRVADLRPGPRRERAQRELERLRRALDKAEGLDVVFDRHMTDRTGKYLVFCASAEHMREMMGHVEEWFSGVDREPHVYSVYSEDPDSFRSFAQFKADGDDTHLRLLFCINTLNEGIHISDISGVILLRPTISPTVYKQQVGRALAAGREKGAVIFDIVNNIAGLCSVSAVQDEIEDAVRYYEYLGDPRDAVRESFQIIDEVQDCRRLFDELEDTLSVSWEQMYLEAERYYKEFGNLLPVRNYVTEDGLRLGNWVAAQRLDYRSGRGLAPERAARLEAIGMDWRSSDERLWDAGYLLAEEYRREHGSLSASRLDAPKLSYWLERQRQKYREGKLGEEKYQKLSALGMNWGFEKAWEEVFREAETYYEKHGDLDVPAVYVTERGTALGAWCRSMRDQHRTGKLTAARAERLEAIGMRWEPVLLRTWRRYYDAAEAYYRAHGDLSVPASYETADGVKLGIWISGQRYGKKKGRLSQEQVRLLDTIGMSWQRHSSRWEEAFAHAEAYRAEYGSLAPPAAYVCADGFGLGAWVAVQRRRHTQGKLKEEQAARLEALGVEWSPADQVWQTGYRHARSYRESHGDLNVPCSYRAEDGYPLGSWIAGQRTRKKAGRMADRQRNLLEELGISWDVCGDAWQKGYEHARSYRQGGGEFPVPRAYTTSDGYRLGEWIRAQERRYRKGILEEERLRKLAGIGLVLDT